MVGLEFLGRSYRPRFYIVGQHTVKLHNRWRKTVNTDAFTFNVDDDASNSFDNRLGKSAQPVLELYELEDRGDSGSRARMLGATLNLAAQYRLPMYKKLSFGLLNSTRIQGRIPGITVPPFCQCGSGEMFLGWR